MHSGGMASLWRVSRPDLDLPMLMKIPKMSEGEDPAAIVSFEMELMIMPRLTGPHVPRFIAAGDFTTDPYIVMERLPGETMVAEVPRLPLPYDRVADMGARVATALDSLHRQHVVHLDVKPSNVMLRPTGEAVMLDYSLAHHEQLPDLMHEEFRLPYGTAPYMAPEQILGVRHEPRSDQFSLGVLLYFFSTGMRPFGESETLRGMKRRLWRDPIPPRKLRPDYPPWLQEIVLRCLEVQPGGRYPTMAQLAFELRHPEKVKLTPRAERLKQDGFAAVLKRRFNSDDAVHARKTGVAAPVATAPIVAVALDEPGEATQMTDAIRDMARRILETQPGARLACLNVLKTNLISLDTTLDEDGNNRHVARMVALKSWAAPLKLDDSRLTVHVLEALDPAAAILEFAALNRVDHLLLGARQTSLMRNVLGSVSAKVASEASCSVTVVRPSRTAQSEDAHLTGEAKSPV